MKVLILGCGRVGSTLAGLMSEDGHDVTVLDRDPEAFRRLPKGFTGRKVLGVGIDEDILRKAGLADADCFVAVTNGDNTNLMAAQIARRHFNIKRTITRVYDPIRAEVYEEFGLETICPTTISAGIIRDLLSERALGTLERYTELRNLVAQEWLTAAASGKE